MLQALPSKNVDPVLLQNESQYPNGLLQVHDTVKSTTEASMVEIRKSADDLLLLQSGVSVKKAGAKRTNAHVFKSKYETAIRDAANLQTEYESAKATVSNLKTQYESAMRRVSEMKAKHEAAVVEASKQKKSYAEALLNEADDELGEST